MVDKVKPLKIEDSTSGTQVNLFPTETNTSQDYIACKGIAFENDDNRLIDLNGSGEIQFTDTNGTVLLSNVGSSPTITTVSSNITLANNNIYLVNTTSSRTLTLPTPSSGIFIRIKDISGQASTNNITLNRAGSESIDGTSSSYTIDSNYSAISIVSDGTDWYII